MTRTTGTRPTAAARTAGALRNGFRERVITPLDADYDKARTLWNGAIDKRAALIARCADATDVAAALRAPLDTGLPIAVRGGGHSVAGTASADDGLVIDLSPMRRRAWVRRFWEALRPHSTGVYVNFLGDEGPDRGPRRLWRDHLRPARPHQGPARPGQRVPAQPEHRTRPGRRAHARWAAMSAPQRPTSTGPPTAQPGRRRPRQGEPPPGSGQETP